MTSIPILDLTTQYRSIQADIESAVLEVLRSGRYIKGANVAQFEQELATYVGVPHSIACNSGTDALYLALRAMDIGPGDEVITSPFTFIATAEVISALGATPVFVDIDEATLNIDLNKIPAAITERTRAIIPVHLFGNPVNMVKLMAIAKTYQLWVIEDCAQAIGATWGEQKVGSFGHIGCFSFYPTKNLGACGDGGAITTNDEAIAHKVRTLADHGRTHGYYHEAIGVNSRLDAVQAVILSIKLKHLDQWNRQRIAAANYYSDHLASGSNIILPQVAPQGKCVWHQYTLRITPNHPPSSSPDSGSRSHNGSGATQNGEAAIAPSALSLRDQVKQQLQQQGISTMVYYPLPLHQQPVYTHNNHAYRVPAPLPIAEQAAQCVLSLPMFPELTHPQQDIVMTTLMETLELAIAPQPAQP